MIGDDVEMTIVDVRGDKVRLGITAPKHIPVYRREIYDVIQYEKGPAKRARQRSLLTRLRRIRANYSMVDGGVDE